VILLGVGIVPIQQPSRPISIAKDKPRGGEKRPVGPKGQLYHFSGARVIPKQKLSQPISAAKDKPGGNEKRHVGPIGRLNDVLWFLCSLIKNQSSGTIVFRSPWAIPSFCGTIGRTSGRSPRDDRSIVPGRSADRPGTIAAAHVIL